MISYINDSTNGTIVSREKHVYSHKDGNHIMTFTNGIQTYQFSHYKDKTNTLNYGMYFYGKIDKNPLYKSITQNNEITMSYEYTDGKISKQSKEYNDLKNNQINQTDSIILIYIPEDSYFTYLDFPF